MLMISNVAGSLGVFRSLHPSQNLRHDLNRVISARAYIVESQIHISKWEYQCVHSAFDLDNLVFNETASC